MSDTEAAWLAGLLEGEGYFQITKPRHHHPTQVLIRLSMTDKDVVEKAARLLNNIPINQKARTTERKTIYAISLSKRDEVEKILLQILPYMGSRRSQKINECLEVIKERRQIIAETRKEQQIKAANIRWGKVKG
jgi:intein/homing endonuclease